MAGKKQNPLIQDMIGAIGSLAEMAHVFYMGMKGVGASEAEAIHGMQGFNLRRVARIFRRRQREKETQ